MIANKNSTDKNPEQTMYALLDDFIKNQSWEVFETEWKKLFTAMLEGVEQICSIVNGNEQEI